MANKSIALFLLIGHLVFGTLGAPEKRAQCNSDNCLRELRHSSVLASPFCSSYLSVPPASATVTVTTTIDPFTSSTLSFIEKRSATTSFSPSLCTEASTAISSGCSCLLALPTVTTAVRTATVVATATATLPPQCDAANNYGLVTNGFAIEDGLGQANHYYITTEPFRGACCARCFETTNCLAFGEYVYPNGISCYLWEVYISPTTSQDQLCPLGKLTISVTEPTASGNSGVGPCGVAG